MNRDEAIKNVTRAIELNYGSEWGPFRPSKLVVALEALGLLKFEERGAEVPKGEMRWSEKDHCWIIGNWRYKMEYGRLIALDKIAPDPQPTTLSDEIRRETDAEPLPIPAVAEATAAMAAKPVIARLDPEAREIIAKTHVQAEGMRGIIKLSNFSIDALATALARAGYEITRKIEAGAAVSITMALTDEEEGELLSMVWSFLSNNRMGTGMAAIKAYLKDAGYQIVKVKPCP